MKIALFSTKSYDKEYFEKTNKQYGFEIEFFESRLKESTAKIIDGHEVVVVFVNDDLNSRTIDILSQKGVKIIALRCAGFNNVDVKAANAKGIKIVRVPAYSPYSVAEHALALILTLNRKTHKAYNRVREGNFSLERLTGFDLNGKTVGVIGTGKIGTVFCNIMLGLGCKVIAFDKYPSTDLTTKGVVYKSMNQILSESDIISLHCPLTPETQHIINQKSIELMKDGVMLINTSRGGLVDTSAAIDALKTRKIGYFGIDVYEQEEQIFFKDLSEMVIPDDKIARLMTFPNVLITSHQAFFTENALTQISLTTLSNISDFIDEKELKNEVTLEMVVKNR